MSINNQFSFTFSDNGSTAEMHVVQNENVCSDVKFNKMHRAGGYSFYLTGIDTDSIESVIITTSPSQPGYYPSADISIMQSNNTTGLNITLYVKDDNGSFVDPSDVVYVHATIVPKSISLESNNQEFNYGI